MNPKKGFVPKISWWDLSWLSNGSKQSRKLQTMSNSLWAFSLKDACSFELTSGFPPFFGRTIGLVRGGGEDSAAGGFEVGEDGGGI